ncbi:hypothetical protein D7X33_26230 [Butyricicoccus sp. 1XD8-22]|nr:hypothetical protein D7X33_26230 [Butyricicoccus sp. 1XD8-22]
MDQEDRYYKLKSWIQRYENRLASIEATKQEKLQLAQKSSELLEYMTSNGLEIKELGSMVIYYYKGEKVHTWFSGISIEEYAKGIEKVYNTYFKQLEAI